MKLAKLLVHALPGGGLFALLLALLLFYLNPRLPLTAGNLVRAWLPLAATYGLAAAVALTAGVLMIRFFAQRPLRLSWAQFALFHRFWMVDAALAAAVWWANLATTGVLLSPDERRVLLTGCGLLTLGLGLGGLLSLQRLMSPGRAVRWGQGAVVVLLLVGLAGLRPAADDSGGALPVSLPELEPRPTDRRVVLVAVDGLSLDLILPLAEDGKAPSFRYLMREGAWGRVESFVPTSPPVIWTTVATGMLPYGHGIPDFGRFEAAGGTLTLTLPPRYLLFRRLEGLGLLRSRPVGSGDRTAPALWNILSGFGLEVLVLDWWATFPPEPVQGSIVPPPPGGWSAPDAAPADPLAGDAPVAARVEDLLRRMADWRGTPDPAAEILEDIVRRALTLDLRALGQARRAESAARPTALALYLPGLDLVQHHFLGYAMAASHSEGADRPGVLFGEVVSRYYRFLDESLGSFLAPEDPAPRLLLVVSGFGVERVPPWSLRRLLARSPGPEGYHDRAPAGAYFALGRGIRPGRELEAAEPVDVLPTLLYFLGIPVGRDLHGSPRVDWFDDAFTGAQPLVTVPSYRTVLSSAPRGP